MQVDPKVSAWIMGVTTFLSIVVGLGVKGFPDYVPPGAVLDIVQTAALLLAIVSGMATGLHLYSSSEPGPLAPPDPPSVEAAAAASAAAAKVASAIAGLLIVGAIALAPADARAANASSGSAPAVALANPFTQIATWFNGAKAFTVADLQAALADAQAQTPPDARHAPCWQAMIAIGQANVANPLPSGLGAAQAIQKVFDAQAALGSQTWKDTLAQACALTALDLGTDLNGLLAKLGVAAVAIPKL
jgi:hypothetical protein